VDFAALAFTVYGVHWFAIGWNRLRQADPRVSPPRTGSWLFCLMFAVTVDFALKWTWLT
jgi:hypothetical protein